MQLLFEIQPDTVTMSLRSEDKVLASRELIDTRQLSQTLLPALDELLVEQKLTPQDIDDVTVESSVPAVYTSYRIVEATARAFRAAREMSPQS